MKWIVSTILLAAVASFAEYVVMPPNFEVFVSSTNNKVALKWQVKPGETWAGFASSLGNGKAFPAENGGKKLWCYMAVTGLESTCSEIGSNSAYNITNLSVTGEFYIDLTSPAANYMFSTALSAKSNGRTMYIDYTAPSGASFLSGFGVKVNGISERP